jgi:hypothetical protein
MAIDRQICRVERARAGIEADLSTDPPTQLSFQAARSIAASTGIATPRTHASGGSNRGGYGI